MKRKMFALLTAMAIGLALPALCGAGPTSFDPMNKIKAGLAMQKAAATMRLEAATSQARYARLAKKIMLAKGKAGANILITGTHVAFDADEAAGTIDTVSTLTIKALANGVDQAEFWVDMLDDFAIETGGGTPCTYDADEYYGMLTVDLPAALNQGETVDLVFTNAGTPNCEPDDFFGMSFCMVSPEITYFAGTDWLPSKAAYSYEDLYNDGPVDIDLTVPEGYVAVTTSDPDGATQPTGGDWTYHFTGNFDATFLALAYAEYATFEATTQDGKTASAFIYSGTTDFGQIWADAGADMVDFFEDVYSPYIFNKHDIVQCAQELGGGVGNQSATFYYAGALTNDPDYFTSESIFSHEIAHQWWGNMIRLGDPISPWINEGFAEYSSQLYGFNWWPEYYQDYLYEMNFRYFQWYVDPADEVPMSSNAIYDADAMTYQTLTYYKGAHLLRMLEWYFGYDDFIAAMSAYAATYSSDVSDEVVDVAKFKLVLEDQTGQDMTDFFQRWVYSTGYPVYYWGAQFDETTDGYTVRIKVDQQQDSATVFTLPLQVHLYVNDEDEPREYRFEFDGTTLDQTIELDAEPRGIRVDKRFWIWGDKVHNLVGDVNSSNEVDGTDLIYVAWCQGGMATDWDHWNYITEADLDRDGQVNLEDMALMEANFGKKGTIDE